jgi:hypothetical protein
MAMIARTRLFSLALAGAMTSLAASAQGAIDMTTGIRYVVTSGSLADCSAKAKSSLSAFLDNATETSAGSGSWIATGPLGGGSTAAAAVHCVALGKGYVVTFSCAAGSGNPYTVADLCTDVAHKFSGKATVALATPPPPPPPPACGSLTNLVGKWVDGDKSFVMTADYGLTGQDGVYGSWYLNGTTATLTYYGDHVLTLSADGKRLTGRDYNLTRKC